MISNRTFLCSALCILHFTVTLFTQAQQPKTTEPDAPATAARPLIQAPPTSGVPNEIKFAAVLRDSSGKPLAGTVSVTFALYDQQEGGAPSWSETQNVEVDAQGRYSVLLGAASGAGVPAELFRSSEGRWLGVRVLAPGTRSYHAFAGSVFPTHSKPQTRKHSAAAQLPLMSSLLTPKSQAQSAHQQLPRSPAAAPPVSSPNF